MQAIACSARTVDRISGNLVVFNYWKSMAALAQTNLHNNPLAGRPNALALEQDGYDT